MLNRIVFQFGIGGGEDGDYGVHSVSVGIYITITTFYMISVKMTSRQIECCPLEHRAQDDADCLTNLSLDN